MIHWILLTSRQGKMRLAKWYEPSTSAERAQVIRDVGTLVLTRSPKMCNVVHWRGTTRIVYKRYASLYFVACIDEDDNELLTMELLHMYVEILDKYFGAVCELDLIFHFDRAYWILDELVVAGEVQEVSKTEVLRAARSADKLAEGKPEYDENHAMRRSERAARRTTSTRRS